MTAQEIIDIGNDPKSTTEQIDAAAAALARMGLDFPELAEAAWASVRNHGQARLEASWLRAQQKKGVSPWGE